MAHIAKVIQHMQANGITFEVEDGRLFVERDEGKQFSEKTRTLFREMKPAILALLAYDFPRLADGSIDYDLLAENCPALLPAGEIPQSFLDRSCARCGAVGTVCRRSDGLLLCACYWTWQIDMGQPIPDEITPSVTWESLKRSA